MTTLLDDVEAGHERAWDRLARPGTWWTGAERVDLARATRDARSCSLCRDRKAALSPFSVDGEHDDATRLGGDVVDVVHRITTDPGRLTRTWFDTVVPGVLDPERYIELVGVVSEVVAVDSCHLAAGVRFRPLPEPIDGEPTRDRPDELIADWAWVPVETVQSIAFALSAVPAEHEAMHDLHGAQYLSLEEMGDPEIVKQLTRPQIELVAARTSVLNECFY